MCSQKESNELLSGQAIGRACMLQFQESLQNPSRSFWGRRKWRRRNICEKSRKRSKRREWEFQGDREEERGWCFLGRSSGKISLACNNLWCEGQPSIPFVCYWDGKGFAAGFMRAKGLRERYLWEQWAKGISVVRNMANSYGIKGNELIFHKGHQKEREMLCGSLLWLRPLWSALKMLVQALDGTAMCSFFLIL